MTSTQFFARQLSAHAGSLTPAFACTLSQHVLKAKDNHMHLLNRNGISTVGSIQVFREPALSLTHIIISSLALSGVAQQKLE